MAASEDQAKFIFEEMRASFEVDGAPMRGTAVAMSKAIEMTQRKSSAKRIPATAAQADGSKGTTNLCDEVHEMVSEEHERALTVADAGTGKRSDSLTVWASTAGNDLSTVFGRKVAEGKRGAFARNQLFLCMEADDSIANDPDPSDETIALGIRQANPLAARGVASVRRLVGKFRSMPLFRAKRYYWNRWVPSDESWLPVGAWDACRGEVVVDFDLPTWVGVDMALKRDSAAIVVVQKLAGGRLQATSKIWVPDGELIDQTECDDYLRLLKATHSNLHWIAADPAWWPTLPTLEEEGLPIFRMPQQGRNMVIAYNVLYRAIVDQIFVHDGSPDYCDQMTSAVPKSTDRGWTLQKGKHRRRIDSAPATAGAMFATTLAPPEKPKVLQKPWVV
jgi:phage terminase large subunit-like protein